MRTIRRRAYEILERASPHDRASHRCDLFLVVLIALNVGATVLESVRGFSTPMRIYFHSFELLSVAIFSVEYLLRAWSCVESGDPRFRSPVWGRLRHVLTPMALIDLLAVLPLYLAAFVSIDLRFLRVLRLLRIFKLSHYFGSLDVLLDVVRRERNSFGAAFFLMTLGLLFAASGIYLFEHEAQPEAFGSIPAAMWWAVVTLTTVGYGDVTPITAAGKLFGASITIMGIWMVALPTGILATGFAQELERRQRVYGNQVEIALEDGRIDEHERERLEELRHELGLSEEDVQELGIEREPARLALDKCPHCGETLGSA